MKKATRNLSTYLLFCFLLLGTSCTSQSGSSDLNADQLPPEVANKSVAIDKLVSTYADYGEFNGAILVAEEGKLIYKKGFGLANMEWDIPNQVDTKFRIGSITKQFTAMLIMQLVAAGKLDLHTPISTYLPDYPKENGDRITLHHIMTHTSGIPNNYDSPIIKEIRPDNYTPEYLVGIFSALPLEFTPGEKFRYCNAGYTLLALIVEEVAGMPYDQALQENIFTPLKMKNTGFERHRSLLRNSANGYFEAWGDYYNANYIDMSAVSGAGAMYSTVEDMFLWDQALYTETLLPQKFMDLVFTKHISDTEEGGHYGYGWSIKSKPIGNTADKEQSIGHSGVIDGFCAVFTRLPASKATVILLSNIRRAPLNSMTKGIMGILFEKPYDFPRNSLAYTLLKVIDSSGINKGIDFYQSHKKDETYYVAEDEINVVSYKLLMSDRTQAAADVLKLGIDAFPNAFNLYDSYGEVLMNLGDISASITNYKKSLQLNPDNENAVRMLKKLGVEMED